MMTIHQPSFNVDQLEGAVRHMIMVCGALSDVSLNDFCRRFGQQRGKKLPGDYASAHLLPRLRMQRRLYQTTHRHYSLNPSLKTEKKGQDAFWVFLENMDGVSVESVMNGPYPSRVSYIKNNRIYHIVVCSGTGDIEIGLAYQQEQQAKIMAKKHGRRAPEERYIFVFNSREDMLDAPFNLESKSLFCVIRYPDASGVPHLQFSDPSDN